jgi:hypothetical protein
VHAKAEFLEPIARETAEIVVPDRDEEVDRAGQLQQLYGGDRTSARRLQP